MTAARVAINEDRLTDLVATAANRSLELANGLLALGNLPAGARAVARTQVWTTRGRRVDLEIVAYGADGTEVARGWFENKVGAAYQPSQLEDYAADLFALSDVGRVVTVVPDRPKVPEDPLGRWDVKTWRDVAQAAWDAGRGIAGDSRWRTTVHQLGARADLVVLDEVLVYIEKEYATVGNPLAAEHILAFSGLVSAYETLDALLDRAALLTGRGIDERGWDDSGGAGWTAFGAAGSWAATLGGSPELHLADRDYWSLERRDHPAFGAGLTLPIDLRDQVRDQARAAWRSDVLGAGFGLSDDDEDGYVRLYRTLYLVEVMTAGATLDEQARHVAVWASQAIDDLHRLVPDPPLETPERRRGRRKAQADPAPPEAGAPTEDPSA